MDVLKRRLRKKNLKTRKPGKLRIALFALFFCFSLVLFTKFRGVKGASFAKTIEVKLKDGQDATKEIQKALDEAAKAGTKKKQAKVSVPKGNYTISGTLYIGSNTYLELNKKTFIKKNPNSKYPVLYMLSVKPGTKGGYLDHSNITVKGGVWDAECRMYNETTSGSLFMFAHTNKLEILNAVICNSFGTHLIELGGVKNCTIKGCELYGFDTHDDGTDKEAIQLDVCHADSILHDGSPFDDTPCEKITIDNCKIHDYPRAIGSHTMVEGIYHKDIKILNNKIRDIEETAVYGYNYVNVTIQGNTIKDIWCAVELKNDSNLKKNKVQRNEGIEAMELPKGKNNINVLENTINLTTDIDEDDQNSGKSIGIYIYGTKELPMKKVSVKGNKIKCFSSGVYIRYIENAEISENTIDRYSEAMKAENSSFCEDAIKLLSCPEVKIEGNNISLNSKKAFENGIALRDNCPKAVVNNNTVKVSVKSGIAVFSTCSVSKGEGNKIYNSGANGILVSDAEVSFIDCTVDGSKAKGISVLGNSKIVLKNSFISNSSSNAIQVLKGEFVLEGNTFTDNCLGTDTDKAVAVFSGAKGSIKDNTFSDPKTKFELFVQPGTSLSPQLSSVKTASSKGLVDSAGNKYI